MLPYEQLHNELVSTFAQYGIPRDIVLYEDDFSGSFFTGNGYIYLDRPESSSFLPLSPRIKSGTHSFLATWPKMGVFCRYCKDLGHRLEKCPVRPTEERTCYTCNQPGHLSGKCPRASSATDVTPPGHKRSRNAQASKASTKSPSGSASSKYAPTTPDFTNSSSIPLGDFIVEDLPELPQNLLLLPHHLR